MVRVYIQYEYNIWVDVILPVMAGIALGCGTSSAWIPHIENIYDHENNTYIY